jgi:digeranylgeranylglycerophospholipid reductase
MKIAIIGAGVSGLACAMECEKLGVTADVFERQHSIGWIWPSVSGWINVFHRNFGDDPIKYLKDTYDINIKYALENKTYIMKSPNAEIRIEGNIGYTMYRGKDIDSTENQLARELRKTPIHYNSLSNYKELSKKYDYVVVASGRDMEAKELGVWEEQGRISIMGAIALGSFEQNTTHIYFDTEYVGAGYARVSPYSSTEAIICVYVIDKGDFNTQQFNINKYFERFLEKEKLDKLELMYRFIKPPFSTGRVSKFKVGNVLLAGRSAGLTERLIGAGAVEAIISGILAARAIIQKKNYDKMVKPLQKHVENISAFRNKIEKFSNDDFDKMITLLGTPGIKQLIYNTKLNFVDMAGSVMKEFNK